jgi:tetratricopeptide (TPR) repeat protein
MKARLLAMTVLMLGIVIVFTACQTKEVTSAKVYIQQDNWEKAIEQLEIAVTLYPGDAEAHYLLGEGLSQQADWQRMNDEFDKSLKIGPVWEAQINSTREKSWVNQFNAGVGKLNKSDLEGAIENFETSALIDPDRVESYKTLGISYTRVDELEKAIASFKKVLELEPDNKDAISGLAGIYFQQKEYQKVVDLMLKSLEVDENDNDAIANLALAYDFLGDREKARETYETALEKNPGDKDLLFNLARLHFLGNEYDEAVKLFNKVLESSPDDFDANVQVGTAYLSMADEFRKSLVENEDKGAETTEAQRKQLIGFYKDAIPFLEKAIKVGEASETITVSPGLYNNLGVAYINVGDRENGELMFKKAEEAE